jgi:hypothetical protein
LKWAHAVEAALASAQSAAVKTAEVTAHAQQLQQHLRRGQHARPWRQRRRRDGQRRQG